MKKPDKWSGVPRIRYTRPEQHLEDPKIVERDGQSFTVYPWGQELPSNAIELFFWQRLRDIEQLLEDPYLSEWIALNDETGTMAEDVRKFANHVRDTATLACVARKRNDVQRIREVRIECGLNPDTGEDVHTGRSTTDTLDDEEEENTDE